MIVGTGCRSITEARLAILMACQHMILHAGIYMYIDDFEVVDSMGAVAMNATIHCEEFQREHTYCTMLDRSSFVGITWRPIDQPISVEIYSTGRANISRAKRYSEQLTAWATLIAKLLRFSSASEGRIKGHVNVGSLLEEDDGSDKACAVAGHSDQASEAYSKNN